MIPEQQRAAVHAFTKKINAGLSKVADELGLPHLTTYTARHTFANISLLKGASKEFIQEALGHQSIMTTENYISGFDLETKRKMNAKL
jgi:integrase